MNENLQISTGSLVVEIFGEIGRFFAVSFQKYKFLTS